MAANRQATPILTMLIVALLSWLVPGAGYFWLKERKRAIILFITITMTFSIGIYVGSIGVIDPIKSWAWYIAQMMTSPAVALLGRISIGGAYAVYGKPAEIGQLYTGLAGLLNLFCIVNAVYLAHMQQSQAGDK